MSIFVYQVQGSAAMNRTDINRISEVVLIPLFAELFGYKNLKSLNTPQQPNYPGIDLGDETARVAFQITSSADNEKLKETLTQFVKNEFYEQYDRLIIYILTTKQKTYSGSGHKEIIQDTFVFDRKNDIKDYRDLLAIVNGFQIDKARRIEDILEANFGNRNAVRLVDAPSHEGEEIYLNLLEISFPDTVYIADLVVDREEVIRNSWNGADKPLKKSASTREVAHAALKQKGASFAVDWECHENKVVTFHNLYDEMLPLAKIIDQGTITPLDSARFYTIDGVVDENRERVFKSLLRRCLQQKLFHRNVHWQHQDGLFIFVETDGNLKRFEQWYGEKENERTVYERTMKNNKPDEILSCKHLAFRVQFKRLESRWYLLINPDWFFSWDGYKRSRFAAEKLKWLKKEEDNKQVFNHFRFIVYFLGYEDQPGLFEQKPPYRFLSFGSIKKFGAAPVLSDETWNPPKLESSETDDSDDGQALLDFSL
jgi:hypothetical protein